jgi:hypothetical protein
MEATTVDPDIARVFKRRQDHERYVQDIGYMSGELLRIGESDERLHEVRSSIFQRAVGTCIDLVRQHKKTLVVTFHNRQTVAILPIEEYRALTGAANADEG